MRRDGRSNRGSKPKRGDVQGCRALLKSLREHHGDAGGYPSVRVTADPRDPAIRPAHANLPLVGSPADLCASDELAGRG